VAVLDSGPLVWLAKAYRLGLLKALFGDVVVPSEVYRGVVSEGLRLGFSDALAVKEVVKEERWIKVKTLEGEERELSLRLAESAKEIHYGEAQAMALARGLDAVVLLDKSCGRALAEALGVETRGNLYVVLRALKLGLLCKSEAKETVAMLVAKGMRLDPRLLSRVLNEIDGYEA